MNALGLFPSQKILSDVMHGVVERVAGIAGGEAQFAAGFGVMEVPEVFSHLDGVGFHRRGQIPLTEQRIDYMRAGDGKL